jgi:hypothetical protein
LALKRFSDTYWPVYAEAFTLLNPTTGEFPDGTSSAVEYIGKAYDPEFGVSWGTPCTTLGCAQAEYTTYALDRDILFIKGHPSILNDTGQEANLTLWQQFIDWIYTEHDLLNINHTEAIAYKYEERTNYTVIMNNAENYTIDLTGCRFNHNMYLTSPDNDGSLWTLYEESGTYIGEILGAGFLLFEKGHSYYLTAERNQPPVFGTPTPVDGSSNNPLSFTWSIPINDPNGNTFSWIIQCNNGQANSGTDASNGTKSLSLSGLVNSASYIILVNASDLTGSGQYTRRWYTFSTTGTMTNTPPVFGTPSPTNSSTGNSLSFTWSIPISDPEGNTFSWTIQCSNGQANSGTGAFNGTKSLSLSGLTNSTTYNIWVNATDPTGSGVYTRKWYTFTTQQQNLPPNKPSQPSGQANGTKKELYSYTTSTTDPNADKVYYQWDWGDGTTSEWLGPYNSGAVISTTHQWTTKGSFNIKVKAKDTSGAESSWSNPLPIKIRNWFINLILQILKWLFQRFPNVFPLLQQFMGY